MKDLLLRTQAATKLRTSIVVMTESEFRNYCTNVIRFYYPRLAVHNYDYFSYLVYKDQGVFPEGLEPYEWWFGTVIGPQSCSRDIGDLRQKLRAWFDSNTYQARKNRVAIAQGDEWDSDLEYGLKVFQESYPKHLKITGYGDNETIRRLRLTE